MSLTRNLVQLIRAKSISDEDLKSTALFTLDALASAYAGTRTEVGERLFEWANSNELDNKRKTLLMAALTHITETDDLHRASVTHPGCIVVPAALSLGQSRGISADKVLQAILHGFEAMCRIGAAVGPTHYKVWHNTATCGPFGAAMAAASLLELDLDQTVHALGNAGTQSSGFWQFMETGAMSKHLHAGRACESGLLASELAAAGFTGPPEILEGEKGFFAGMCVDPEPTAILASPEDPWQLCLTSIKPWPSCRHTHPTIDCALELHGLINGVTITAIEIETYQAALDVCDRADPVSEYQAKFSLYHCVASALLNGRVTLDSFDSKARQQTSSLRAITRVSVVDPYASSYPLSWGSGVKVFLESGQILETRRKDCKGDPELALNDSEMRNKAKLLLQFGGINAVQSDDICDRTLGLAFSSEIPTLFGEFIQHLDLKDASSQTRPCFFAKGSQSAS